MQHLEVSGQGTSKSTTRLPPASNKELTGSSQVRIARRRKLAAAPSRTQLIGVLI
jgi:hypothetical protein